MYKGQGLRNHSDLFGEGERRGVRGFGQWPLGRAPRRGSPRPSPAGMDICSRCAGSVCRSPNRSDAGNSAMCRASRRLVERRVRSGMSHSHPCRWCRGRASSRCRRASRSQVGRARPERRTCRGEGPSALSARGPRRPRPEPPAFSAGEALGRPGSELGCDRRWRRE